MAITKEELPSFFAPTYDWHGKTKSSHGWHRRRSLGWDWFKCPEKGSGRISLFISHSAVEYPKRSVLVAPEAETESALYEQAMALSEVKAYVETNPPAIPALSGNLIIDLRSSCGLTTEQIAYVASGTAEAVAEWRKDPEAIPDPSRTALEAVRAVGAILVGGLGPTGVAKWFFRGPNPPAELVREGHTSEVVERAEAYEESIAT